MIKTDYIKDFRIKNLHLRYFTKITEMQSINENTQLFKPKDFKLTLVNKGINSQGNRWFLYAKPNGAYAFMYKNQNGKSSVKTFT